MNIFQKQIADLKASGLSYLQIAKMLRENHNQTTVQTTITRLANGEISEPKWSLGEAIKKLHKEQIKPDSDKAA